MFVCLLGSCVFAFFLRLSLCQPQKLIDCMGFNKLTHFTYRRLQLLMSKPYVMFVVWMMNLMPYILTQYPLFRSRGTVIVQTDVLHSVFTLLKAIQKLLTLKVAK